jgi:DNA-binding transcriptional MerR regulator
VDKSPEAFRTISEVAEDLDLPQHVLRFWETRFSQIKPLKRGGGRRYYRPDDVDLLKGIRYYLYGEGYTIRGVQRILKDRGIRHVTEMGRAQNENYAPPVAVIPRADEDERRRERQDWPEAVPQSRLTTPGEDRADGPAHADGWEEVDAVPPDEDEAPDSADNGPYRPARPRLAPEAQDILEAVLRELLDCKRLLDQAR